MYCVRKFQKSNIMTETFSEAQKRLKKLQNKEYAHTSDDKIKD